MKQNTPYKILSNFDDEGFIDCPILTVANNIHAA